MVFLMLNFFLIAKIDDLGFELELFLSIEDVGEQLWSVDDDIITVVADKTLLE